MLGFYLKVYTVIFLLVAFFLYHFIRYRNPYKLYMVFGKKGSGKSMLMCKLALKYGKRGFTVYCNSYIPGTYYFDAADVGFYHFPENSVLLVDEVGMIWDNRDFKSFKKEVRDYFKLQRHYRHIVFLFSQSFDVDKKLRDLTDHMYLILNVMNCFSIARRITKTITISHADKNSTGETKLVDDMKFDPLIFAFFGGIKFTYIPRYVKYFNSFDTPQLPLKEFQYIPLKELPPLRQRIRRAAAGCAGAARRCAAGSVQAIKDKVKKCISRLRK
ncbi:zonular occludens toxin domain-containing protein [Enterocloster lavalensis]|uniref:zonular occludens toxin domain-containing protein n=1 Tax=Enterocloster lavalensis TaxID=460384 RepID=UPI0034A391B7